MGHGVKMKTGAANRYVVPKSSYQLRHSSYMQCKKIPYSIKEYIRNAYTHISLWKKVKHREKKNRPMPLYLSLFTSSFIYNFSDVFIKLNSNLFKASV